jgi:alpha-N-arabinofuranosidase
MPLDHYIIKHNMFGKAMRAKDPSIQLIGSGATPEEMTIAKLSLRTTGELVPAVGSKGDWTGNLLLHCRDYIDVMSEHFYCYDGQRFDLEVARTSPLVMWSGFVKAEETLLEWTRRPADRVRTKVEAYQDYLERLPGFKDRFVPMNIDEWAYARLAPCLKQALSYAWALHEMFRHTDLITMAAYTFATSCVTWNGADAILNTTGMVFKFYRDHYGVLPLAVSGNRPQPGPKYPVGGEQPRVSAGSPTYPLDVHAALTADRAALTVAVVNPGEEAQRLALNVEGIALKGGGRVWRLSGPHPEATNALGKEPEVTVTEAAVVGPPGTLAAPPLSASIYRFEVA